MKMQAIRVLSLGRNHSLNTLDRSTIPHLCNDISQLLVSCMVKLNWEGSRRNVPGMAE